MAQEGCATAESFAPRDVTPTEARVSHDGNPLTFVMASLKPSRAALSLRVVTAYTLGAATRVSTSSRAAAANPLLALQHRVIATGAGVAAPRAAARCDCATVVLAAALTMPADAAPLGAAA